MDWDTDTQEKVNQLLKKVPVALRGIAQKKVSQKAESLAREENRESVCEKNLVDAIFAETPFGFHGPMKCDMEEIHLDYTKYGHPK
jgi:hypothetical protein